MLEESAKQGGGGLLGQGKDKNPGEDAEQDDADEQGDEDRQFALIEIGVGGVGLARVPEEYFAVSAQARGGGDEESGTGEQARQPPAKVRPTARPRR